MTFTTRRQLAYWALTAFVLSNGLLAQAHDWYPPECCGQRDCGPADAVERRDDGSYRVVFRGKAVVIPSDYNQWKISPDGRVHVCVAGSGKVLCAFRAPDV